VVQVVQVAQVEQVVQDNRGAMAVVTKSVELCIALVAQAELEEPVARVVPVATVATVARVGQ